MNFEVAIKEIEIFGVKYPKGTIFIETAKYEITCLSYTPNHKLKGGLKTYMPILEYNMQEPAHVVLARINQLNYC